MIFVIGGETASGKSDLAFKFAKKINGIIINGDAFAVYKELEIGTAKPSAEELSSLPSFLFNVVSINEPYSIYDYQVAGRKVIEKYLNTNTPIIIVGGSGLYIRALLYNYALSNEKSAPLVDDVTISNETLYQELVKLDSEAALKIHPNNRKRVLRALAIIKKQNIKKSTLDAKTSGEPLYPYVMVALAQESSALTQSIKVRTEKMFKAGLKTEVLTLGEHYNANIQALQAIGYKEILANKTATDAELITLISQKTRQLAKRQRTFFKNQFMAKWFTTPADAYNYLLGKYEEQQ